MLRMIILPNVIITILGAVSQKTKMFLALKLMKWFEHGKNRIHHRVT